MRTTATNKKLRVILSALQNGTLVPNPSFQRRLVWSSKHKNAFLRTVLGEFPFPEIYVAAGSVNPETAEGTEELVDGQQRITTLYQYFKASPDLKLEADVMPYATLKDSPEKLRAFLEYEVVVRDLGQVSREQIIEVFRRINSTKYSLSAVEVHNARFDGAFKSFGESVASHEFFERHKVFAASSVRRMGDLRFAMTLVVTMLSTYFNRDDSLEDFLSQYNDEFPFAQELRERLKVVFEVLDRVDFDEDSVAWNEVNLLPLAVEIDRASRRDSTKLNEDTLGRIRQFFDDVEHAGKGSSSEAPLGQYYAAQRFATADRSNRIKRGTIIAEVIDGLTSAGWLAPKPEKLSSPA